MSDDELDELRELQRQYEQARRQWATIQNDLPHDPGIVEHTNKTFERVCSLAHELTLAGFCPDEEFPAPSPRGPAFPRLPHPHVRLTREDVPMRRWSTWTASLAQAEALVDWHAGRSPLLRAQTRDYRASVMTMLAVLIADTAGHAGLTVTEPDDLGGLALSELYIHADATHLRDLLAWRVPAPAAGEPGEAEHALLAGAAARCREQQHLDDSWVEEAKHVQACLFAHATAGDDQALLKDRRGELTRHYQHGPA